MILRLDGSTLARVPVPPAWSGWVSRRGTGLEIVGDRTAERNLYLYVDGPRATVATDIEELLDDLIDRHVPIRESRFGVSSLLHNGMIPLPSTLYRGVRRLGMGDRVHLRTGPKGWIDESVGFSYPWSLARSHGSNEPDQQHLLDLLTAATTERVVAHGGRGALMLSSGKDSTAVALALAEGGFRDVVCVTYRTGPDDPEPEIAARTARRLGLTHQIVDLPSDSSMTEKALTSFFERNALPGTDLSQIPYIFALASLEDPEGVVLDGGGNDPYMGYPPSGHDITKLRYRIRGRRSIRAAQRVVRIDSPMNYLARSRAEATLPGRTPRMRHIRSLYPAAVDVSEWWHQASWAARHLDDLHLLAEINERHTHPTQTVMKQRLAAHAVGMASALPWADHEIADYYFGLPEEARFDRVSGTNKLLLREMLAVHLDYDADAVGKHYFEFDAVSFIVANRDFIRSQIDESPLWDPKGLPMVHRWLEEIESRPLLYHALLTVFMISGWSNHCRFGPNGSHGFVDRGLHSDRIRMDPGVDR